MAKAKQATKKKMIAGGAPLLHPLSTRPSSCSLAAHSRGLFSAAGSVALLAGVVASLLGCAERSVGTVELLLIHPTDGSLHRPLSASAMRLRRARTNIVGDFGDPIRYSDDVITIRLESAFVHHLPFTLTGSTDVVLFAEVWENAASAYNEPALNRIVYLAKDQRVPGRLNFNGNLAYGPTKFKGHPLKLKLTLMVLQKRKGEQYGSVLQTIGNFASSAAVASPYGVLASEAISIVREILRSQPDVIAFDFEATFLSDDPKELLPLVRSDSAAGTPPGGALVSLVAEAKRLGWTPRRIEEGITAAEQFAGENMVRRLKQTWKMTQELVDLMGGRVPGNSDKLLSLMASGDRQMAMAHVDTQGLGALAGIDAAFAGVTETSAAVEKVAERVRSVEEALETLAREAAVKGVPEEVVRVSALDQRQMESPWNGRMAWLEYGMYALVELERYEYEMMLYGSPRTREIAGPIGIDEIQNMEVDGGWIRRKRAMEGTPSQLSAGIYAEDGRLNSNYLVFSVTPGQIAEDNEALRAASDKSVALLRDISRGEPTGGEVGAKAATLGAEVAYLILKERVRGCRLSDGLAAQFDRGWQGFQQNPPRGA